RVPVADVQGRPRLAALTLCSDVVQHGRGPVTMQDAERHAVVVEHRRQGAAHSPLLGPDLDALGSVCPAVPSIAAFHTLDVGTGSSDALMHSASRVSSRLQPHGIKPLSRASRSWLLTRFVSFLPIDGINFRLNNW